MEKQNKIETIKDFFLNNKLGAFLFISLSVSLFFMNYFKVFHECKEIVEKIRIKESDSDNSTCGSYGKGENRSKPKVIPNKYNLVLRGYRHGRVLLNGEEVVFDYFSETHAKFVVTEGEHILQVLDEDDDFIFNKKIKVTKNNQVLIIARNGKYAFF